MAEQFLITNFQPLWNLYLDGFGNHAPGKGRHEGEASWWDARHPGRASAAKLRQTRTQDEAKDRIREYHRLRATDPSQLEALAKQTAEEQATES